MTLRSLPEQMSAPYPGVADASRRDTLRGWLKSDSLRTVLSVIDQFVFSGLSFATAVIVGRGCSPELLGVFFLAMTLVKFMRSVQGYVISAPYMIYSQSDESSDIPVYTGSVLGHEAGIIGLTVLGLAAALVIPTGALLSAELVQAMLVLMLSIPFVLLYAQLRRIVFARMRIHAALLFDLGLTAVQLTSLLILWRSGRLSPSSAIGVMGIVYGLACAVWFATRQQSFVLQPGRLISDFARNWKFGRWALASFLVGQTSIYLLPWVIAFVHGEAATGVLAACLTLANLIGTFVTGIGNFAGPRAAKSYASGGANALKVYLKRIALVYLLAAGGFCVCVVLTGDLAVRLVYGEQYHNTGTILAVLAFQVLFNCISITSGNGLWAMDQPRPGFIADVCTIVVTLAILAVLITPLGVLGAAVALLAGTVVGAAVRTSVFFRLIHQ